jgi:hypothetical protein
MLTMLLSAGLVPQLTLAQSPAGFRSGFDAVDAARGAAGVREFNSIGDFILAVLGVVAALVAVLALVALVWGAVMYITSLGDEGRVEKAKKIIIYALVGLLILGVAGILVNVVINLIRR